MFFWICCWINYCHECSYAVIFLDFHFKSEPSHAQSNYIITLRPWGYSLGGSLVIVVVTCSPVILPFGLFFSRIPPNISNFCVSWFTYQVRSVYFKIIHIFFAGNWSSWKLYSPVFFNFETVHALCALLFVPWNFEPLQCLGQAEFAICTSGGNVNGNWANASNRLHNWHDYHLVH